MIGKLNEDGELVLVRAGREVNCVCPFMEAPCSESCPQMTEPIRQHNKKYDRFETVIHLCHGKYWKFTEFEDRRQP
jgi:hypothetical protein